MIKRMMITASPDVAEYIEQHGVDRIFLDQEVNGKAQRQGHLDTHKAAHTLADIEAIAKVLRKAELMVRINPLHDGTTAEIEAALNHGAQRLMLPMFTSRHDVAEFLELVGQRVPVTFLAETAPALVRLADWLPLLVPGRDEVHFGLNDLSLSLGLDFLFEPMAGRLFDAASEQLEQAGITWGIGGIARIGQGELPAENVIGEHVRLDSRWVILSRAFHSGAATAAELLQSIDFPREIAALTDAEQQWRARDQEALLENHQILAERAFRLGRKQVSR
ncbi:aldolase/citrate lyase family protein [Halomonas sp. E19]|uniref:aldolase/citrate lyase family protein n=1 Tax=unclassified Halomonas TaxID=2609666 RepID=UPI004033BED0